MPFKFQIGLPGPVVWSPKDGRDDEPPHQGSYALCDPEDLRRVAAMTDEEFSAACAGVDVEEYRASQRAGWILLPIGIVLLLTAAAFWGPVAAIAVVAVLFVVATINNTVIRVRREKRRREGSCS